LWYACAVLGENPADIAENPTMAPLVALPTRGTRAGSVLDMIEIRGLTKRYGRTTAVDNLTVTIQPGIVTGFLGPNGAGKSTTMRMILGLDRPTSGSVTVNGMRYADAKRPLHQLGGMLDPRAVHPSRSAFHHLLALAQISTGVAAGEVVAVMGPSGCGKSTPTIQPRPRRDIMHPMFKQLFLGTDDLAAEDDRRRRARRPGQTRPAMIIGPAGNRENRPRP